MNEGTDSVLTKMQSRIALRAGDNSVIDNAKLPHLDNDKAIILTEGVYDILRLIMDATNVRRREVPFVLYGKFDSDNQMFVFDNIDADASADDNPHEAVFSHELTQKILDFGLGAVRQEGKVLAHGHSHPRTNADYYLNFSLGDMRAFFEMRNKTWLQNVWFCGCLLTGGNFNFVFCDGKDVYRFDKVFVQDKNGNIVKQLPCFGRDVTNIPYMQNRGRE